MNIKTQQFLAFLTIVLMLVAGVSALTSMGPTGFYTDEWGNFTTGIHVYGPIYGHSTINGTTIDTGQGATEVYAMDQDVQTTDPVTFDSITVNNITLNGDTRTSWTAAGAFGDLTVSFEFICFTNVTGSYYQDGQTGAIVGPDTDQNILDWAYGNSTGGIIYIKKGVWNAVGLSDSTNGIHIIGDGRENTILQATGAGDVLTLAGANQVVEHLSIDGNDAATDGLVITGARARALHLYIYDCDQDGVEIGSTGGAYIEDVRVKQVSTVRQAGTVGVNILNAAADIEVLNSIISECETGIDMSGGTNRIFTNHIWGNVVGVDLCQDTAAHGEYIIANNFIEDNTHEGIRATGYYTWATSIIGNCIDGNGVAADATYANILFNQTLGATDHRDVIISGNTFDRIGGTNRVLYHIWTVNGNGFTITDNINSRYSLTVGSPMFNLTNPTNFIVRDNNGYGGAGYITINGGTGSITSGGSSDVITHGLDVTPESWQIRVTGLEDPTNAVGTVWIDTITSTQFTVHCENDPGVSNWDFAWYVDASYIGW